MVDNRSNDRLARELRRMRSDVDALARSRQFAFSTVSVDGSDIPVGDLLVDVVKIPDISQDLADSAARVAEVMGTIAQIENGTLPALQEAIDIAQATADSTIKVHHESDLGEGVYPALNDGSDLGDLYYRLDGQVERWVGSTKGGWILVEDTVLAETIAALREAEGALTTLNTVTLPALNEDLAAAQLTIAAHTTDLGGLEGRLATTEGEVTTAKENIATALGEVAEAKGAISALNTVTLPGLREDLKDATDGLGIARGELDTLNTDTLPNLTETLAQKLPKVAQEGAGGMAVIRARDVLTFSSQANLVTDNIVIVTNVTPSTMLRTTIKGYNYEYRASEIDIEASCYFYGTAAAPTINQSSALSSGAAQVGVRFARTREDSPRLVIILSPPIGTTGTQINWRYVSLTIPELLLSYSGARIAEAEGWVGEFVAEADLESRFDLITIPTTSRDTAETHSLTQGWRTTGTTTIDGGKITADSVTANQIKANTISATELAANAVYADAIQANAVTVGKIAANAVTANTIKAGEITAGKLGADAVVANNIKAGEIVAGKLATDAVLADNIKANAITATKIAADAVTADKIETNAVTAEKIKAGAISADKIEAGTITGDRLAANTIAAGQLLIGNFNNLIPAADDLLASRAGFPTANDWGFNSNDPSVWLLGSKNRQSETFTLNAGDKVLVSADMRATAAGYRAYIGVQKKNHFSSSNGNAWPVSNVALTTGYVTYSGVVEITETRSDYTFTLLAQYAQSSSTGYTWVRNPRVRLMTGATTIEDGAITTDKVKANAITANEIMADTITGKEIKAGSITAAHGVFAQAAIVNADIQGLSAQKITTDTLSADRIAAGSIAASKLTLTDLTNLIDDPGFKTGVGTSGDSWSWGLNGGTAAVWGTITSTAKPNLAIRANGATNTGTNRRLKNQFFTATAGDKFRVTFDAQNNTTGNVLVRILWTAINGGTTTNPWADYVMVPNTATGWQPYSFVATAPAGAVGGYFEIYVYSSITSGYFYMHYPSIYRMANAELIVDGAITALKIDAKAVVAGKIDTDAVTADEIKAGSIITTHMAANSIDGDRIRANTLDAGKIKANSIKAGQLAADAIDGKVITGATVQTAKTGERIVLNNYGSLSFYPPTGMGTHMLPHHSGISINAGDYGNIFMGSGGVTSGTDFSGIEIMAVMASGTAALGITRGDILYADNRVVQAGQPIAYRQAAGERSVPSVPANNSVNVTVSMPSGRFTKTPIINADTDDDRLTVAITARSATSATIRLTNRSALASATSTVMWQAIQMLTSSSAG